MERGIGYHDDAVAGHRARLCGKKKKKKKSKKTREEVITVIMQ